MNRFDWLSELLARFQDEHILLYKGSAVVLAPAHTLNVDSEDWASCAAQTKKYRCRFSALWAQQLDDELQLNACYEKQGDYLVLRTKIPLDKPLIHSITPHYANADRPERHCHDMFGIEFKKQPDNRRWSRHKAWQANQYPLRKDFPVAGFNTGLTPPDNDYPFLSVQGSGVYEIPVGPVHAGIIEPGHFRFQAVGEMVLNLEQHLGYVHKGIEKIAEGRDAHRVVKLAARVSGDSCVSHAWASCLAMEKAALCQVPPRAVWLRALMAERERVANHLGDIGAIANDVAFGFFFYQFGRLRETWQRLSQALFGHRLMMDCLVLGGVTQDINQQQIDEILRQIKMLRKEWRELKTVFNENTSLEDRLETTGILSPDYAQRLGCVGYVGRASGQDFDVRRDLAYAPYNKLQVKSPCYNRGDVAARTLVRLNEIQSSLDLIEQICQNLPTGEIQTPWQTPKAGAEGLGFIDGWRGEIVVYVRFAEDNKIDRFFPRDPSWLTWPALEHLIRGNIVPDFPVCNKSVNGSYSGHDL